MIEVSHLVKRYGDVLAVDDLTFTVRPGEVLGFLGPNGAGKTTTMRIIAGFVSPTSGSARVCGHDVEREPLAARRLLGYLPEGAPSWPEMTPRAFLGFVADVRGLERGAGRRARLDAVIERLGLGPVLDRSIETLSKGFRRRVGLAQAILHDPPVLVLDEPTDGLDPNQKHEVRTLIESMAPGKTIVVSTHILEEVAAVCTRAIIVAGGRLLVDDTPRALEARSRYHNAVTLRLEDPRSSRAAGLIGSLPQVERVEVAEHEARLTALASAGQLPLPAISELVRQEHLALRELQLESGRLDEVFRDVTRPETRA